MEQVAAYSTLAMTLSLVVTRPRVTAGIRVSPAAAAFAGVVIMALFGVVDLADAAAVLADVWRSFVAIAAIMVMTEVGHRVGLLDLWAARIERRARTTFQLFALVFALGVVTATALNNDAAILLLTPLVVALCRRRYPERPGLAIPFAFAVFIAAGVAPLVVSNPMNMIVAEFSGIGFNHYAAQMIPIAAAGWLVAFVVLSLLFRKQLSHPLAERGGDDLPRASAAQRRMMVLLAVVLGSYSLVAYAGKPVWVVATLGALVAIGLARHHTTARPAEVVRRGVSWGTLAFLGAVLVLATGLVNVGFVTHLTAHYADTGIAGVGVTSAIGSALLNNHPMAYMNMMALEAGGHGDAGVFAALIGGDLGPRLLPMGSLAGLLWLEMLRRHEVEVPLGQFVKIGFLVTVPALAVSLGILALY